MVERGVIKLKEANSEKKNLNDTSATSLPTASSSSASSISVSCYTTNRKFDVFPLLHFKIIHDPLNAPLNTPLNADCPGDSNPMEVL